jgi:hypothetical protein
MRKAFAFIRAVAVSSVWQGTGFGVSDKCAGILATESLYALKESLASRSLCINWDGLTGSVDAQICNKNKDQKRKITAYCRLDLNEGLHQSLEWLE